MKILHLPAFRYALLFVCFFTFQNAYSQYFRDADGDGFGNPNLGSPNPQTGYVNNPDDCNDNDPAINPNTVWFADPDGDGYGAGNPLQTCNPGSGWARQAGDCDNSIAAIRPGLPELCDGIDQNCDGQKDEGLPRQNYYPDADGDGFGSASAQPQLDCTAPNGRVANNFDCNDQNPAIRPGVSDGCGNGDEDCDGQTDEDGGGPTWFRDADGDGYGNPSVSQSACTQPGGYVSNANDCNDNDLNINPLTTWYADPDGDGYGAGAPLQTCNPGSGWARQAGDCDNSSAAIRPGLPELCDGIDQNCDGQKDEGLPRQLYYRDADGDGFGNPTPSTDPASPNPRLDCSKPTGYVANDEDCDDLNAQITLSSGEPKFLVTNGGLIGYDESSAQPFVAERMVSRALPTTAQGTIHGAKYYWVSASAPDFSQATAIPGAHNEKYKPEFVSSTTWFCRFAYHQKGCKADAKPSNWVVKAVQAGLRAGDFEEKTAPQAGLELQVFPNPTPENVRVLVPAACIGKPGNVQIFNNLGEIILSEKWSSLPAEAIEIGTANWREGWYWLEVSAEGQRAQQRAFLLAR